MINYFGKNLDKFTIADKIDLGLALGQVSIQHKNIFDYLCKDFYNRFIPSQIQGKYINMLANINVSSENVDEYLTNLFSDDKNIHIGSFGKIQAQGILSNYHYFEKYMGERMVKILL
jgi:hypothetical protein